MFQGTFAALRKARSSVTSRYLNGLERAALPAGRSVNPQTPRLILSGAQTHNLKNLTVAIPLGRFVCLSGVSGSGKTTLAREELFPALESRLRSAAVAEAAATEADGETDSEDPDRLIGALAEGSARLAGCGHLTGVVLVDQAPLGRTPRSNPAVYVGAFDDLRELYTQTELARQRGLTASAFSFNSSQGQCERCRGAGFEKIEMQFLSDVQIRCPDCLGRRYRPHILEIRLPVASPQRSDHGSARPGSSGAARGGWSIADLLEATVDEVMEALVPYLSSRAGERALARLRHLQEVGLGYLRLGQPINTLSGGESQRLKLASHLAEHAARLGQAKETASSTLFIFDEPTTGLHFHDVRVLLQAFQRLVQAGHSLLVIEHNLDVIQSADWIIDLGPEGGEGGGRIVVEGTPADVAGCDASHTGAALREALKSDRNS